MEKNPLHIGLAALRALIILLGAGLLMAVSGASMPDESFLEGLANYGGALDAVFYIVYGAGIACTAAALGFGVYFFAANFKDRKAQLIGLVVFLAMALVSFYGLADDSVLAAYETAGDVVSNGVSQFAGGGIWMVYLLGITALATIVWTEVSAIFK
jgi:hypothetical protein